MEVQVQEALEQMIQNESNYVRNKSELESRLKQAIVQKQYEQVFATTEGVAFQLQPERMRFTNG